MSNPHFTATTYHALKDEAEDVVRRQKITMDEALKQLRDALEFIVLEHKHKGALTA